MNPQNSSQGGDALGPVGSASPQTPQPQDQNVAAANVIRGQIDALYNGQSVAPAPGPPRDTQSQFTTQQRPYLHQQNNERQVGIAPRTAEQQQQTQPQAANIVENTQNPYDRTHTNHPQPQAEQWKAYHSAWQNYYQKYYEAYYQHREQQNLAQQTARTQAQTPSLTEAFTEQPNQPVEVDVSKDEALFELRQKLLGKVRKQATKIRGSKHFIPIVAALSVVLIFVFIQYNRVFIATVNAYVSPGSMDPQNIVIDPSSTTAVSSDPRLIIPKINVDVPVLYDVGADYDSQMAAMEKGVAHFAIPGANSHPGEVGNTALSGHSSNDLFDPGDYKFIFAQLEKLNKGDTIYANYKGTRYTYVVTKTEVVLPTQVDKLIYPTDKPIVTLITCTPLGTAQKRLLVTAEQISPDPAAAASAPAGSGETGNVKTDIPGSSPTLFERLFGAR